ncbi:MAG: hypothetical protein ACLSHN_11330 [Eubacterium sp.]
MKMVIQEIHLLIAGRDLHMVKLLLKQKITAGWWNSYKRTCTEKA